MAQKSTTQGKPAVSNDELPKKVRKPIVLIADDDEEIIEVLSSLLESRDFQVLRAVSGYDALGLVLGSFKGEIDAVISDVNMPNGSGLNLLEALRKMNQSLPVFLMTGDPTFDHRVATKAGANGVVPKPIDTKSLVDSLRTALDHVGKGIASA